MNILKEKMELESDLQKINEAAENINDIKVLHDLLKIHQDIKKRLSQIEINDGKRKK